MSGILDSMSAQSKAAQRLSFHLCPAGIVIGYLLTLFAVVAGVVAFPFSSIWMGLLFVLVGAFFVVAIPIILMAYLLMTIAICRAIMGLGRRLVIGSRQNSEWQRTVKPFAFQKSMEPASTDNGLLDRWIDGLR
jgi:hypothetical protein